MSAFYRHILDPSKPYVAPPSLGGTPHTVLRERIVFTEPSTTGNSVMQLGVFGPIVDTANAEDHLSRGIMHRGLLADASPKYWTSSVVLPTDRAGSRVRLSSMQVNARLGVPSNGFLPQGLIHILSSPTVIDFGQTTAPGKFDDTYQDIADFVKTRPQTRTHTGKTMLDGVKIHLQPNDMLQNAALLYCESSNPGENSYRLPRDSWGSIVIVREGTQNADLYLTIHLCWTVEYTRDLVLQQTHSLHNFFSEKHWAGAKRALDSAHGQSIIGSVEEAAGALGVAAASAAARASGLFTTTARAVGAAAPEIEMAAPMMALYAKPRARRGRVVVPRRAPVRRRRPPAQQAARRRRPAPPRGRRAR